jgi:hypothetical protein
MFASAATSPARAPRKKGRCSPCASILPSPSSPTNLWSSVGDVRRRRGFRLGARRQEHAQCGAHHDLLSLRGRNV